MNPTRPKQPPQLAKLTRPRLHKAVARERLFALLDEACTHDSAACVVGPPGAGKTTLVASWLDARRIKGIWYQVDAGDVDLASFFYYLGKAAKAFSRKRQRSLPTASPEYLQDIEQYSRRFFRELFTRLPHGAALVLDNYQELPPEHHFHRIISQAIEELPAGISLLLVTRYDPPGCYARLIAHGRLQLVEWEDLQFTLEETRAVASGKAALDDETIESLHARSGGWAAGLTLLLENKPGRLGCVAPVRSEVGRIFEYFADHIFDQCSASIKYFLMATAHLPHIAVSMAEQLTGSPDTRNILEDLYRRHLFIHRRPGEESIYQYHALFQTFLLNKARTLIGDRKIRCIRLKAAQLLETGEQFDDAFQQYCGAQDWSAARGIVLKRAETLLGQGRFGTLIDWIRAVPADESRSDTWLKYWHGMALLATDLPTARRYLEIAFNEFSHHGDRIGQCMAAAGSLDTYFYEYADYRPLDRWLDVLKEELVDPPAFPSESAELGIYCAALIGLVFRQPGEPLLETCVGRVTEMLDLDLDVNRRLAAAAFVMNYCCLSGDLVRAKELMARSQAFVTHPEASDLNRYHWLDWLSYYWFLRAEYAEADCVLQYIQENFVQRFLESDIWLQRSLVAMGQGDLAAAHGFLAKFGADFASLSTVGSAILLQHSGMDWVVKRKCEPCYRSGPQWFGHLATAWGPLLAMPLPHPACPGVD